MPEHSGTKSARYRAIGSIALRILLAIAFIGSGLFKLSGHPMVVDEFNQVGLGQWLRYFTATLEIVGGVLLLIPRTVFFGAVVMTIVCVGAFGAQLLALHGDVIHTIVLAAILAAIAWSRRHQLSHAVGSRPTKSDL